MASIRKARSQYIIEIVAVLLFFCLVPTNTAWAAAPTPQHGGTLVRVLFTGPDNLDPAKAVSSETDRITFNIYEGLVAADAHGKLYGRLSTDWDVSNGGKTYTFRLRQGVKFHNGRELTAADVKFSFDRLMDESTGYAGVGDWDKVKSITVTDRYTVKIELSQPYAPFLAVLASPGSFIVPQESVETLETHPIGTGPFRFVEWVREDHVTLQRFADYWQADLPYLDAVVFRFVSDSSTTFAALQSGDADVVNLSALQIPQVQQNPRLKVVSGSMNLVQIMAMNGDRNPWNDIRVRQAVAYAVDRKMLIDGISWGRATPLYSGLTQVNGYYADRGNPYPHSVTQAKQLLTEAGYPNGFETTLVVPEIYEFHVQTAELLQQQFNAVGIRAKIELVDWARWLKDIYAGENYDLTIIGFTGKLDPHSELKRYVSDYGRNFMNFADDEYDALIRQALQTSDTTDRMDLYRRAQEILALKVPVIFIVDPDTSLGVASDVYGWTIYPNYVDDLSTVYRSER